MAHLVPWQYLSRGSPGTMAVPQLCLTWYHGSTSAVAHLVPWQYLSRASPGTMAVPQPWLTWYHGSTSAVAHLVPRQYLSRASPGTMAVPQPFLTWYHGSGSVIQAGIWLKTTSEMDAGSTTPTSSLTHRRKSSGVSSTPSPGGGAGPT